jgi:glycosyltransferase involved in cell wall biosynthesis
MKVLVVLTYYRPHTSGLTIYAERLAKAMVERGHRVTILTSRYDQNLAREEMIDGVKVVRAPVLFRISKGVVMPTFGWLATKLVLEHDVIHLHLPQLDAAGIALRGRLFKKPTVITYHCDLQMPQGVLSWAANQGVNLMNHLAARFSHRIVAYTNDYASHSSLLKRYAGKIEIINPPVELPIITASDKENFIVRHNPENKDPIIGMAARFATEKGVEVLLGAVESLVHQFPELQAWFAGPYKNILGEEQYLERLFPRVQKLQATGNWKFLGLLDPEQMVAFYQAIDMLVLPSINSTESFGLVQIEAMMNGKPVIASDLPGVRQPVLRHAMGEIIPIGNSGELAKSIEKILQNPASYHVEPELLARMYSPESVAEVYEKLFSAISDHLFTRK